MAKCQRIFFEYIYKREREREIIVMLYFRVDLNWAIRILWASGNVGV